MEGQRSRPEAAAGMWVSKQCRTYAIDDRNASLHDVVAVLAAGAPHGTDLTYWSVNKWGMPGRPSTQTKPGSAGEQRRWGVPRHAFFTAAMHCRAMWHGSDNIHHVIH